MLRQDLNKKSKARVKIDGFLYPNIFLINNQHSLKSYKLGNIENFSKGVFFRLTTFFSAKKNYPKFFFLHSVFNVLERKKNFQSDPKNFWKFFLSVNFEKKKKMNFFSYDSEIFFYFPIHKKLNGQKKFWIIFLSQKKSC